MNNAVMFSTTNHNQPAAAAKTPFTFSKIFSRGQDLKQQAAEALSIKADDLRYSYSKGEISPCRTTSHTRVEDLNDNDLNKDQEPAASLDSLAYSMGDEEERVLPYNTKPSKTTTTTKLYLQQETDGYCASDNGTPLDLNLSLTVSDDTGRLMSLIRKLTLQRCESEAKPALRDFALITGHLNASPIKEEMDELLSVGSVQLVIQAMIKYPNSERIQFYGAAVLWNLAECHEPSRLEIIASGGDFGQRLALALGSK